MLLSVIISTKNHADIIERALESVKFADEIVVVDMYSNDETVKIAQKYTDKVFQHKDYGYVEPVRNFSISKTIGDWILIIDADEEVSQGLKKAIQSIVKAPEQTDLPDCFYLPRKNIIFDKWIERTGWWPDYQLRFFRKGHVEWSDQIHSVPTTKGEVKEFPAQEKFALIHHNYQSISQFIERLDRYSTIQAQEKKDDKSLNSADILKEFHDSFLRRLFAGKGIQEGIHGVILAILQSTADAVIKMKSWENQGFSQENHQATAVIKSLEQYKKELAYWIADFQISDSHGLKKVLWRLRRKLMV
ncbi:glycosyltransferase family 2 protein [Patescibacteria group bacterium]|nr:glycosyltransferase family 2 protein [Patescibacteria group bacterium]